MPKLKTPKKPEDRTPVFTWLFQSSKAPLVGGSVFSYVAQLNQDETVSCNCPGWRFVKKGQPRRCKHTDAIKGEVPTILKSWREGEKFEVQEFSPHVQQSAAIPADTTSTKNVPKKDTKIKFNRRLEF